MQTIRKITDILNVFVAVFASLAVLALVIAPMQKAWLRGVLLEGNARNVAVVIAGVTLACNLIARAWDLWGPNARRVLELPGENGSSAINIHAIEGRMLDVLNAAKDVSSSSLTLYTRGEGVPLLCEVSYSLHRVENVTGRADEIKNLIRQSFLTIIPNSVGVEIHANVKDIVREKPPAYTATYSNAESAPDDFRGPVYPVGGGDEADDEDEATS